MAKAAHWVSSDAEARKLGERAGLDTPVVLAVNDEHLVEGASHPLGRSESVKCSAWGVWSQG